MSRGEERAVGDLSHHHVDDPEESEPEIRKLQEPVEGQLEKLEEQILLQIVRAPHHC